MGRRYSNNRYMELSRAVLWCGRTRFESLAVLYGDVARTARPRVSKIETTSKYTKTIEMRIPMKEGSTPSVAYEEY